MVDLSVVSASDHLKEKLLEEKFNIAILEASMINGADLQRVDLPVLLWPEGGCDTDELEGLIKVRKYQRISSMIGGVLEQYARSSAGKNGLDSDRAYITAVWSPAGGVGKTSIALAHSLKKATEGKQAFYLNLEQFSSTSAFFPESGRSISSIFEMLEAGEGDLKMLVQSIRQRDRRTDLSFFCCPENFDDMNILTTDNVAALINACCEAADELIIDMSCSCDERNRKILEFADRILLVTDSSATTQTKLTQFASQHNVFQCIKEKTTLVANKGATAASELFETAICVPFVQSNDAGTVYRTLSGFDFN